MNIGYTSLVNNLENRSVSTKNLQFIYASDRIINKIGDVSELKNQGREDMPVIKKYKGKYIQTYETITEAAKKNGLSFSKLHYSLKSNNKCGEFEFYTLNTWTNPPTKTATETSTLQVK